MWIPEVKNQSLKTKKEKRWHPSLLLILTKFCCWFVVGFFCLFFLKKGFFFHCSNTKLLMHGRQPVGFDDPSLMKSPGHGAGVEQDMGRCRVFHTAGKRLHSWVPWVRRAADGLGWITQRVAGRAALLRSHQLLLRGEVVTTAHTAGSIPTAEAKHPPGNGPWTISDF